MKATIYGAGGRMGRTIVRLCSEDPDISVVGAVDAAGSPHLGKDVGELAGVGTLGVEISADLSSALLDADVLIDFTIAAAFGNVHGVYKPGNVKLTPSILDDSQRYIKEKHDTADKPVNFVFHGGSGSTAAEIEEAISYGVIKMNIDTDLQWASWNGVRAYEAAEHDFLQGQLGNPTGADAPNKKQYDPRVWLRAGEDSFGTRLEQAFAELQNIDTLS